MMENAMNSFPALDARLSLRTEANANCLAAPTTSLFGNQQTHMQVLYTIDTQEQQAVNMQDWLCFQIIVIVMEDVGMCQNHQRLSVMHAAVDQLLQQLNAM